MIINYKSAELMDYQYDDAGLDGVFEEISDYIDVHDLTRDEKETDLFEYLNGHLEEGEEGNA